MTLYIIHGDNNEMYEDYYEWIEGIYLSEINAKKELVKLKRQAEKDYQEDMFYPKRRYRLRKCETKD